MTKISIDKSVVTLLAVVVLAVLYMITTSNYALGVKWSPDGNVELAPARR